MESMGSFRFSDVGDFDTHIKQSIRGYTQLTEDIIEMSPHFIDKYSRTVDFGCSTGKMLQEIGIRNKWTGSYTGIDIEKCFQGRDSGTKAEFITGDIFDYDIPDNTRLALMVFTLQFLPPTRRIELLSRIYTSLQHGGALVVSEKIHSTNSTIQDIISMLHLEYKREFFTSDEILDKEKSLRGVMKINTREAIIESIKTAGFTHVDTFWQQYNFIGIIAIK